MLGGDRKMNTYTSHVAHISMQGPPAIDQDEIWVAKYPIGTRAVWKRCIFLRNDYVE